MQLSSCQVVKLSSLICCPLPRRQVTTNYVWFWKNRVVRLGASDLRLGASDPTLLTYVVEQHVWTFFSNVGSNAGCNSNPDHQITTKAKFSLLSTLLTNVVEQHVWTFFSNVGSNAGCNSNPDHQITTKAKFSLLSECVSNPHSKSPATTCYNFVALFHCLLLFYYFAITRSKNKIKANYLKSNIRQFNQYVIYKNITKNREFPWKILRWGQIT